MHFNLDNNYNSLITKIGEVAMMYLAGKSLLPIKLQNEKVINLKKDSLYSVN
jgi:hypothetical protein